MASIHFRLLFILLGLFIVAWLAVVGTTYAVTQHEIEALFDAHLEHDARILAGLAAHRIQQGRLLSAAAGAVALDFRGDRKVLAFRVWRQGKILLHSVAAPDFGPPAGPGYRYRMVAHRDWRVFSLLALRDGLTVQVGEPYVVRHRLVYEIARDALYPLLLAIPVLGILIWIGVGRGLAPLGRIAAQVARRSPSSMVPVVGAVPVEVKVLTDELNALLALLRDAFERERQFTTDAAHEIRTPLAAIKANAQLALRTTDQARHDKSLQQINRGVDCAAHLVEQLLTLARLDQEAVAGRFVDVDLVSMTAEVLASLASDARGRGVSLALDEAGRGCVRGNRDGLAVLVRNLVDNAIRYTPRGGHVEVAVTATEQGVALTVADDGPGIPPGERRRVFDRFYRGGTAAVGGCGLGLSIVQRIANLHGASVELGTPAAGIGLRVCVQFLPQGS